MTHPTANTKTTLGEFGPDSVWYTSIGVPAGDTVELFYRDEQTGERIDGEFPGDDMLPEGWWGLAGSVNDAGEWEWDGRDHPTDWNRNTVLAIKAFPYQDE